MTEDLNAFFSAKHKRLLRIASLANIFAWLALTVYMLLAIGQVYEIVKYWELLVPAGLPGETQLELLLQNSDNIVNLISQVLSALLPGIIDWLVLKGAALGLNMLVETDINYRERRAEGEQGRSEQAADSQEPIEMGAEENAPVFFEPQEVLKIEGGLSWLAIIAIFVTILINIPQIASMEAIISSMLINAQVPGYLPWVIAIGLGVLAIGFKCLILYYSLRALAAILNILMEMEFNSRGMTH